MEKLARVTCQNLQDAPEGRLRIAMNRGSVQYYYCDDETSECGRYLPKGESELIKNLAQKRYDEKVYKLSQRRVSQIRNLLKDYEEDEIERLFTSEHPERRKLVEPVEATYMQSVGEWISQEYRGKAFKENTPVITTNRGLRVRSKSEKIMADYFDTVGILYKYECPLYLRQFGYVYPDFTFLSRRTREEIYWEHEGMMDDPEYAQRAVKKIDLYEKNGIYPGEKLILTFETSDNPLNTDILQDMVGRYLL